MNPEEPLPSDVDPSQSSTNTSINNIRIISLNCWGLKFISKHRHARLVEIGRQLAQAQPTPSIVGLQECWTQQDYLAIRDLTRAILPYGKFYWSGIFGGGLAILSRWPIDESCMFRYLLNGRPAAFYRGDWYVGKGVACARIRFGPAPPDVVEVFCTHLHAPYEREPYDSYICHRTAQAWEIARLMRHAAERGHLVLGLGDFNMVPCSLAHRLIEAHAPVRDVWRVMYPDSALGSADSEAETARARPVPSAVQCLAEHGATCDSTLNTWRWSPKRQKALLRGGRELVPVDPEAPDRRARRLDYIFFTDNAANPWEVVDVGVGMTMRHPSLRCSLSDHFSVEATIQRKPSDDSEKTKGEAAAAAAAIATSNSFLPVGIYDEILAMITKYTARERKQRRWRLGHFGAEILVALGCWTAVWFPPYRGIAFALMVISTLGLSAGVLDGLMGGLFVGSELRALREFEYEIGNARMQAERRQQQQQQQEGEEPEETEEKNITDRND